MPLCPTSVLITGASRGLGLEFVKQFVKLSTPPKFLFAACRSPDSAKELQDLAQKNVSIIPVYLDVTDYESISKCADIVSETVKDAGLNLLINNAGVNFIDAGMLDVDPDNMMEMFKVNAVGPTMVTRTLLPILKKARANRPISEQSPMAISQSAVVNISSDLGSIQTTTTHNLYGYRTSKAAFNMVSRLLSNELNGEGVFVVGFHPGWVRTDMGGPNGNLSTGHSVRSMMGVMDTFDGAESHGKFLGWDGKEIPW